MVCTNMITVLFGLSLGIGTYIYLFPDDELLSEKKGILESRSKHLHEIHEFEQLDNDIQGIREQMKNGRIASPPRKRARFWWFGA